MKKNLGLHISAQFDANTKELKKMQNEFNEAVKKFAKGQTEAVQATKRLAKAQKDGVVATNKMRRSFAGLGNELKGFVKKVSIAAAIYGIVRAFKALQDSIVKTLRHIAEFENRIKVAFGKTTNAMKEFAYSIKLADRLGVAVEGLRSAYAKTAVAAGQLGWNQERFRKIFEPFVEAGRVFNLTAPRMELVFLAIEQMISKGKVSYEELRRQLGEQLPGALQIAARAMGVTGAQFDAMLRKGEIFTDTFLPKFSKELRRVISDQLPEAMKRGVAEIERMKNAFNKWVIALTNADTEEKFGELAKQIRLLTDEYRGLADAIGKATNKGYEWAAAAIKSIRTTKEERYIYDAWKNRPNFQGEGGLEAGISNQYGTLTKRHSVLSQHLADNQGDMSGEQITELKYKINATWKQIEELNAHIYKTYGVTAEAIHQSMKKHDDNIRLASGEIIRKIRAGQQDAFTQINPHPPTREEYRPPDRNPHINSVQQELITKGKVRLTKEMQAYLREDERYWNELRKQREDAQKRLADIARREAEEQRERDETYRKVIENMAKAREEQKKIQDDYVETWRSTASSLVQSLRDLNDGTFTAEAAISRLAQSLLEKFTYKPAEDFLTDQLGNLALGFLGGGTGAAPQSTISPGAGAQSGFGYNVTNNFNTAGMSTAEILRTQRAVSKA